MTCATCGGEQAIWLTMPIDAKKNAPTAFGEVVRCNACGLGVARNMPTPAEVATFYDLGQYYTHGESHIPDIRSGLADRLLTKLAWFAEHPKPFDIETISTQLPPGAAICDIGCGPGEQLIALKQLGFDVIGVDPDPEARRYAASRGVTVLEGTGEEIPASVASRRFDLVRMSHSLEHCIDPMVVVRNVFALLKPGGHFYCEVPNCACEHFQTFTVTSEMFDLPRHLYFFTPDSLQLMLAKRGFVDPQWYYMGFVRQHLPGWRAWEATIHDRLVHAHPQLRGRVRRHTLSSSVGLLLRTAFAGWKAKYDSVGLLMRRPA